jgi:hypothetical protein
VTILAFGGEMGWCVPSDSSVAESSLAAGYDSAFARGSVLVNTNLSYAESIHISAQTDFWFHCECYPTSNVNNLYYLKFVNSADTEVVRLKASGTITSWTIQPQYLLLGTWTNIGTPITINHTERQTYDIHIDITNGTLNLYLAGTNRISASATLSGISDISYVRTASNNATRWSQCVMADEPTIGWRLGTIYMTGQGATHTFTTGGFGNIDELVYSDADFINSDTANQVELFTGTAIPNFSGYVIRAVGVYARARRNTGGPQNIQLALKSGATTYFSSTKSLDFAYGAVGNVWETDPATSVAWVSTAISSLQFGVKSIA